jgi:hypothetical protein
MFFRRLLLIPLFLLISLISFGQISLSDTSITAAKVLLRKEKSGFLMIHTSGFGLGYRSGKHITGYKKRVYELELTGMKHPKEIRTVNRYYENAKSYIYGKKNSFYILRGGIGIQKIINSKPYWGGVELRYFYYGGLSLGFLKPVYLYILKETNNPSIYSLSVERYDPDKHFEENIFGRAPFFYRFGQMTPVPGIYLKTGLNFEFGVYDESLKAIEAGVAVDGYLDKVPIMATEPNSNYFVSLYLSFHIGSRRN